MGASFFKMGVIGTQMTAPFFKMSVIRRQMGAPLVVSLCPGAFVAYKRESRFCLALVKLGCLSGKSVVKIATAFSSNSRAISERGQARKINQ
jgi:hypothetical protein